MSTNAWTMDRSNLSRHPTCSHLDANDDVNASEKRNQLLYVRTCTGLRIMKVGNCTCRLHSHFAFAVASVTGTHGVCF